VPISHKLAISKIYVEKGKVKLQLILHLGSLPCQVNGSETMCFLDHGLIGVTNFTFWLLYFREKNNLIGRLGGQYICSDS
jgi:hypothetical protein